MKKIIQLVFLSFLMAFQSFCYADSAPVAPAVVAPQTTAPAQAAKSNEEIRQWYNDQVAVIPDLNEQWKKDGLSAEERAKKAHEIRHHARVEARSMMQNKQEVAELQARDQEKYGNPDGPTFEFLVEKNRLKGFQGDAVYEDIVGSSNRTNKEYNEKYGVKKEAQSP
jgi:hypothetical protein